MKIIFEENGSEIITKSIKITNHSPNKNSFTISFGDYKKDTLGKMIFLPSNSSTRSIISNIDVFPNFIELEPNESKSVEIKLNVSDSSKMSLWGILYVKPVSEKTSFVDSLNHTKYNVSPQVAVKLNFIKNISQNDKIEILSLKESSLKSDTIRTTIAEVKHSGEGFVKCFLEAELTNMKTLEQIKLFSKSIEFLPESNMNIFISIPKNLKKGKYELAVTGNYSENDPVIVKLMMIVVE